MSCIDALIHLTLHLLNMSPASKRLQSCLLLERRKKSYRYLNLLMPLSGSRYNRSADVVGMREPQSSNTGLDRTHHGWAKLPNTDTINPVFPHTYLWTVSGQD